MRNKSFSTFDKTQKAHCKITGKTAIVLMSSDQWSFDYQTLKFCISSPDREHITLSGIKGNQLFLTLNKKSC